MSLNIDFIQKANEAVAKAKSFKMSELAGQMLNLTQSIKLTKKPIDKDEQEIDNMYYKDTFGPFGGVAKTIGYAAKTDMGLDEYNEIDENILKKLSKMESKFHENYLPELLLEIGKDYGEQENEAIKSATNPLAQIGLDMALIKFYWTLTQLQLSVSIQNLEAGMNGSSKVSKMKDALRQLQAMAQNLTTIAAEYDWEVGGVEFCDKVKEEK
ncbi:hypothetical protein [uncultured Campylobacter sp.]|uniref:hypothetical protein n=1 Tax=uncultured Campylobacter sp. TaxID=218934 RepID=UPI002603B1F0|nr:hypothetical protein [uncultured Campylobacter sp.]